MADTARRQRCRHRKGCGRGLHAGNKLGRGELVVRLDHERRDARDHGCCKAGAKRPFVFVVDPGTLVEQRVTVGVRAGCRRIRRCRQAFVAGGIDRIQAGQGPGPLAHQVVAIARRRGDANGRCSAADIAVADFGAHVTQAGNGQHPDTACRSADRPAVVAGGRHHEMAILVDGGHGILFGLRAAVAGAEAEIEDMGRVGIARHAGDRGRCEPCRPVHAGDDIRDEAAAFANDAHRHDVGAGRHAGDARAVIGLRGGDAGHAGAVPGAVDVMVGVAGVRVIAAAGVVAALHVGSADPVAGITRIGIPAVAIVGGQEAVADGGRQAVTG